LEGSWRQERQQRRRGGSGSGGSGSEGSEDRDGDRGHRYNNTVGARRDGGFQRQEQPAWRSRLLSSRWVRREPPASEFFCNVCNKDLKRRERYEEHLAEDHVPCSEPGCRFSGPEHVMGYHRLKHTKAADGTSIVDSPEEQLKWLAARRACFPSAGNLKRKADGNARRYQLGALPEDDRPKPGLFEKMIRQTAFVDAGGKGCGKGKGKGKFDKGKGKGKDKGKGKFDKGKSKGKEKGKGKGKGWGSGGDWQGGWHQQDDCHAAESSRPEHVLVSTPLASMVANCVPLEAPFGNSSSSTFGMPQDRKWTRGMCRFFERGFCYHGDRCQYEHAGNPGQLALTDASSLGAGPGAGGSAVGDASSLGGSEATWWALPSTLANRACPGPQPPPDARRSSAPRLRPTFVRPARELQERMRRDGLLRRMLRPEVDGFYSTILQCVRYVVDTDFLRQERALRSVPAAIAGSGGLAPSEAPPGAAADTEDLDTADAATLAAMELDL